MQDRSPTRIAQVIAIPSRTERRGRAALVAREQRRLEQATRERRRLDAAGRGGHGAPVRPAPDDRRRAGGRAWVNGREVGGAERRLAHLGHVHD